MHLNKRHLVILLYLMPSSHFSGYRNIVYAQDGTLNRIFLKYCLCLAIWPCRSLCKLSCMITLVFGRTRWTDHSVSTSVKKYFVLSGQKINFADSVQTEYCTTFPLSVRAFVTGVTSHISHIYKGINAMLIIRGPIKPYIF